jgi:hypothetical protein
MQEESFILLPVTIPQSDLEAFINQSLPTELYSGSEEELGVAVEGKRVGNIVVRMEEHEIFYRVDMDVLVKKSTLISNIEGNGRLRLELKTSFIITDNWRVDSQTVLEYHEWIERPKLKVGIATFSVKTLTDSFLKRNREKITNAIDRAIQEKVLISEYIQPVWNKMQEPVIGKEPFEFSFVLCPKAIQLSPPLGRKDNIWTYVYLPIEPILKVGSTLSLEVRQLPVFSYHYKKDDNFTLSIPSSLSYNMATRLASENLRGKALEIQGQTILIEMLQVGQAQQKVSVDIGFSGSVNGIASASFYPGFSSEENDLLLNDLSFDLKTKNVLAKGAIWLFKERIIQTIRKHSAIFLNTLKVDIKEAIQKELDSLMLPDMAKLDLDLDVFDITAIDVEEDGLVIQALLQGSGKLLLELMKTKEAVDVSEGN